MISPFTRRQFVKRAAVAAPALGALAASASAAAVESPADARPRAANQQATPTASASIVGEATMPNWRFTVSRFADPYEGEISRPSRPPENGRFVGAEIIITNDSDQPMDFSASDVRLRDADGVEYSAGPVVGEEPKLVSQNLPEGERTRGWVWFIVPEETPVAEIRFSGPTPTFRVGIPNN